VSNSIFAPTGANTRASEVLAAMGDRSVGAESKCTTNLRSNLAQRAISS